MRFHDLRSRNAGFTLVEMIVTIVVGAVVFALGSTILSSGFQAYFVGREITNDDWQARLALERMTRELRGVRTPTAADLTIGVAGQITFTDFSGVSIIYRQTGTILERSQGVGAFQPLADNIKASTLAFTYLQNDGATPAGTAAAVYYIAAEFTVKSTNVTVPYRGTVKPTSF